VQPHLLPELLQQRGAKAAKNCCGVEPAARIIGAQRRRYSKNFLCLLCLFAAISFLVKPLTIHTCKLTDEQASALNVALRARNWKPREVPYARFAFESDKTNIVFYESGKLVVQERGRRNLSSSFWSRKFSRRSSLATKLF
jgi:hypothetical protein